MIVSTMTLSEIQREIDKDFLFVASKVFNWQKKINRLAQKIKTFPYSWSEEIHSPHTKITYIFRFIVNNKYKLKNPSFIYIQNMKAKLGLCLF